MKNSYKLLFSFTFSLFFITQATWAQQLKVKVSAKENGYNRISVPQEFRAHMVNNPGMLRLKDKDGTEIPFILKSQENPIPLFSALEFKHSKNTGDSTETFLLNNESKKKTNNYVLKIANATTQKKYSIEGSEDMQNWFGIVNNAILTELSNSEQTYTNKQIQFPLVDYRYIRIVLDNKTSAPIRVLTIGELKTSQNKQQLEKIKDISYQLVNNRSEKETVITVSKKSNTPIDYLQIYVGSPKQYYRIANTSIDHKNDALPQRNRKSNQFSSEQFQLQTNIGGMYVLNQIYPETFSIKIDNEDNPPLQIDSILFYQSPIILVAEMDTKKEYSLMTDSNWTVPSYDLSKIELNLPPELPLAKLDKVEVVSKITPTEKGNYGRIILTVCLALGAILIFYFGRGLLKDLKKD